MDKILVPIGGLKTNSSSHILTTFVGSCVAVCMYDPQNKVASMSHVMQPTNVHNVDIDTKRLGKFADEAIPNMISQMERRGSDKKSIVAKIAGGAKTFSYECEDDDNIYNIGRRNVESIKQSLTFHNIELHSEDIGNQNGRWVTLNVDDGLINVKTKLGIKTL
ncbi:chemotaxis protein CheD [Nitrosopumilus sp. Nsub]|uniref:chemotaxis protein CheD n=1 Tax=Nitrosopumilus sp. Nsub TaxID=1776294 RepID=UPI000829A544|nr:chemotaxis protein CheD [Nitrosopumilus sp. Nsub]